MKKAFVLFLLIVLACSKNQSTETKQNVDNKQNVVNRIPTPTEELPNVYTEPPISKNLGVIKFNPESGILAPGQTNVIQVLAQLIKKNPFAVSITINYTKQMSSDYSNEMTIEYDRTSKSVTERRSSGAQDIYSNVIDQSILNLAKDPQVSSFYMLKQMENATFTADDSKMKKDALGPKPEQKDDFSVPIVTEYLKNQFPSLSIEHREWSKVTSLGKDWVVRTKYSVVNGGETKVLNQWFYIQNSKVVKTKDIQ